MKPALAALLLTAALVAGTAAADNPSARYRLSVDGLACPFCAYGLEKQLRDIRGIGDIRTDIVSGHVTLTLTGGVTLDEAAARRAVEAAGFTLRRFEKIPDNP
ncbi:MAG: heavy-metal-associated domain-containing protein [Rhodospirillales bacterium]